MATAQTVSPSAAEGRCSLFQPTNTTSLISADEATFQKPTTPHLLTGHVSAPDIETEGNAQNFSQSGKQGKMKRRKRRNSFNENTNNTGGAFNYQAGKRRRGNSSYYKRQANAVGRIILPTKFLLGGNINDPLNLNSMMDENINRALNAVTPSSSPLPPRNSIIDIVTPNDVTDPLGLNSSGFTPPGGSELLRQRGKRKRRRKSQAIKQQELQQQNPDTSSNSDDQKGASIATDDPEIAAPPKTELTLVTDPAMKKNTTQNRKKKHSPLKGVGYLNIPVTQANIRDPIVSPAVPQDTRRSRSSFGLKQRRRRHGTDKPMTSDAGIQTDSNVMLMEENVRCGSEKIGERHFFSPVKRRRTVSESLSYWTENPFERPTVRSFFAEPNTSVKVAPPKDVGSLLPKPIGACLEDPSDSGKSPAQNYMNKEVKDEPEVPSTSSTNVKERIHSAEKQKTPTPPKNRTKHEDRRGFKSQNYNNKPVTANKKSYNAKFQYGNYNKYYGYRNVEKFKDIRMECLKREWFKEKDVLDIGCNAGHLTLLIARDYEPRKIVGVDIDDSLIRVARNNIRHYASTGKSTYKFPASMTISHGPLACPPVETGKDETTAAFPNNVNFFQGNYVPQKEEFLQFQEPEYDVIMCMSVSKWIHLNWGDAGLIRMFKRVFKQLRAGGMFILEPQQWSSYSSKRKICEKLNENYRSIKIRPDSFPELLIREIGFKRVDHFNLQKRNKAAGFQRPIQVYYKPE